MTMELIYRGVKVNAQPATIAPMPNHHADVRVLFRGQAWTWLNWDKKLALPTDSMICYRGLTLA